MAANEQDFSSLLIRPKILRDVSKIDIHTDVFGARCPSPLYLTSIAKGGLVSPREHEKAFVRAAWKHQCPYIVPTVATAEHSDIFAAAQPNQLLAYQFYLLGDNEDSMRKLNRAVHLGCKAVVGDKNYCLPIHINTHWHLPRLSQSTTTLLAKALCRRQQ